VECTHLPDVTQECDLNAHLSVWGRDEEVSVLFEWLKQCA